MSKTLAVCVLLGIIGLTYSQAPPGWPCSVDFPCVPEQTYGHPTNCSLFYLCAFPEVVPFILICPDGTVYNPAQRFCDFPENTVCEPDCTAPVRPDDWPCNIPHPCIHDEQYGVPSDCSKYYLCIYNRTMNQYYLIPGTCTDPTPLWDSVSRRCERETTAVCEPNCTTSTQGPTENATTAGGIGASQDPTEGQTEGTEGVTQEVTDGQTIAFLTTDSGIGATEVTPDVGTTEAATDIVSEPGTDLQPGTGLPFPTASGNDPITFSATLTWRLVHLSRGQLVPFNHVDADREGAFVSSRGSFMCPYYGTHLYRVSVHIRFRGKTGGWVSVIQGRHTLARLVGAKHDVIASSAMVTKCQKGERISVVCSSKFCDIIGKRFTFWTINMLK